MIVRKASVSISIDNPAVKPAVRRADVSGWGADPISEGRDSFHTPVPTSEAQHRDREEQQQQHTQTHSQFSYYHKVGTKEIHPTDDV